jgi:hypothetical protein
MIRARLRQGRGRSRSMRQRVESDAFVVRQNQRNLWASQSHPRLLVDEYDGPRHLFHFLRDQDTSAKGTLRCIGAIGGPIFGTAREKSAPLAAIFRPF